eukprot:5105567-Alexandrium_andersonii.AAC.1
MAAPTTQSRPAERSITTIEKASGRWARGSRPVLGGAAAWDSAGRGTTGSLASWGGGTGRS